MTQRLVIGSRGSELALWQARYIQQRLKDAHAGLEVEIEIITSKGDKIQDVPLAKIGGKGLFTKELEVALLDGSIDLAVHSLKDLPTELPAGLALGAVPEREQAQDAFVGRTAQTLAELAEGATVGTSSLRRCAQLLAARPDLNIVDLRGNVPTRVEKLESEGMDAIILAAAGLIRLEMAEHISETLDHDVMLPAVSQGALGIEIRDNDPRVAELVGVLHDEATYNAVTAERALLSGLGGGCQTPLGASCVQTGDSLALKARIVSPDGTQVFDVALEGTAATAQDMGQAAAQALLAQGADVIVAALDAGTEATGTPLQGKHIVITRAKAQSEKLTQALEGLGAEVTAFPTIEVDAVTPEAPICEAAFCDWLIFTSANGVRYFQQALKNQGRQLEDFASVSICAIGTATASLLQELGLSVSLTPNTATAEELGKTLTALEGDLAGKRIVLPRGNLARTELPEHLREAGASVTEVVVYETRCTHPDEAAIAALMAATPDAVTFTSASTAENLATILGNEALAELAAKTRFASIGPVTTEALDILGYGPAIEAEQHDIPGLVRALTQFLGTSE